MSLTSACRLRARRLALVLVLLLLAACRRDADLPEPDSDAYREAVIAFYTSLAALQAGEDLGAEERLLRVTALAPGEPAAWANLGLLALRRGQPDAARRYLAEAHDLAPDAPAVLLLLARMESETGRFDAALGHLRRASEIDPGDPRVAYALVRELERQEGGATDEGARLLDAALARHPDNLALLLERVRAAILREHADAADAGLGRLADRAAAWPGGAAEALAALREAVTARAWSRAATQAAILRNVLLEVPAFRDDLLAVQPPAAQVGDLVTSFLRLPPPPARSAPPDTTLAFTPTALDTAAWDAAVPFWPTNEGTPLVVGFGAAGARVGGRTLDAPFTGGAPTHGLAALDADYDFRNDLALAGPGGLRLYRQADDGFRAVSADALPAGARAAAYTGAWAADVDLEGDLDLVLGRPDAPPLVLRNDGDGTFSPQQPFSSGTGLRAFAWADLDADADPDAALLDDAGRLHLFANERRGVFTPVPVPTELPAARALTAGDVDAAGGLDLVLFAETGDLLRLNLAPGVVQTERIAAWADAPGGDARLFVEDLDNNGGLDLVASAGGATRIWLRDADGSLRPHADLAVATGGVADYDGDGRLDLVGWTPDGAAAVLRGRGTMDYHWQAIRPQAALAIGDQRINPFGIGGLVEVRSGLLYQQHPITRPVVHVGLGTHETAELVRITWPNGDVQAEFDLAADGAVLTPQRLKGSCPWVFADDGTGMRFVTDFIWRSPLGLSINAQETAGVMMTEDWIRIRGDQLAPRDGHYDLRITAELWETHFFDHVALLVVDHPADVDVWVDERFAFPPPPLAVQPTAAPRPVAAAWDAAGRDVTDRVRALDEQYLGAFRPGAYQGLAEAHYVEIDLGAEAPSENLRLLASGWIRPTDSSINVALSQGALAAPEGLRLEVPDGRGGWRVARHGLGFPAGKTKTIVLDLDGLFEPGAPRRLRLHTTMEIYWDALAWTTARPDADVLTRRLAPTTADLRYRGFSRLTAADRTSPELPDYGALEGTAPRWLDLEGYYTRFGDVRELLAGVDDRYVIMNAGDELRFLFPAPPPPPEGWRRDFVLVGDGWVKDGDLNTAFSRTVRPLPSHDRPAYDTPPGRLADDPVYRRHAGDWARFHTRYVTPEAFLGALRPGAERR